ncbi:hypothetical protein EVAR_76731_1 [Eumeta japonica]|uniref:Uncharacterized protein n=1 Tax=Eumeta variegata TaxID=151549 RepID=A0A4C1ST23_EUMVA|nr:hypothetical protein EVAR_76731_1 [Eumeta japonica]
MERFKQRKKTSKQFTCDTSQTLRKRNSCEMPASYFTDANEKILLQRDPHELETIIIIQLRNRTNAHASESAIGPDVRRPVMNSLQ